MAGTVTVNTEREVCTFDGNYGREGRIWTEIAVCDVCKQRNRVLCIDASEGEYSAGQICLDCITNAFE
jgi:hypothetical protein